MPHVTQRRYAKPLPGASRAAPHCRHSRAQRCARWRVQYAQTQPPTLQADRARAKEDRALKARGKAEAKALAKLLKQEAKERQLAMSRAAGQGVKRSHAHSEGGGGRSNRGGLGHGGGGSAASKKKRINIQDAESFVEKIKMRFAHQPGTCVRLLRPSRAPGHASPRPAEMAPACRDG